MDLSQFFSISSLGIVFGFLIGFIVGCLGLIINSILRIIKY